jgi:hypothetical protein
MTSFTTPGDVHQTTAEELIDGRYRLTALLQRAEATDTWQAHDARLGREVVIELIHSAGPPATSVDQLQQTLSEKYSHLAQVYDAGNHLGPRRSCTFVVTTLLEKPPPLPVGDWQVRARSHRASRSWLTRRIAVSRDAR